VHAITHNCCTQGISIYAEKDCSLYMFCYKELAAVDSFEVILLKKELSEGKISAQFFSK